MLPSSKWLGHQTFNLEMRLRLPLGVHILVGVVKLGLSCRLVKPKFGVRVPRLPQVVIKVLLLNWLV